MNVMLITNHLVHNQNKLLDHFLAALEDLVNFQQMVTTKSAEKDNK